MFTMLWLTLGTLCFLLTFSSYKEEAEKYELDFLELASTMVYHLGGCLLTWPYFLSVYIYEVLSNESKED